MGGGAQGANVSQLGVMVEVVVDNWGGEVPQAGMEMVKLVPGAPTNG